MENIWEVEDNDQSEGVSGLNWPVKKEWKHCIVAILGMENQGRGSEKVRKKLPE